MKISLTSIPVNSPPEAFTFYTEVLGFVTRLALPEANVFIVVSPEEPAGTGLLLEPNENPLSKNFQEGVYKQGIPLIVFGVADLQQEYEKLKAKGVIFKKPPTKTEWGFEAVLDDTCGNYIQLQQL